MNNNYKLYITYNKKIDSHFIILSNNKILWQFDLNNKYKKNNGSLKLSKKMNQYLSLLINISIFGLCPTNNSYEIYKN